MAFTLSSLFIIATGLPTSLMDWLMSSSSRSLTLRGMLSGSGDWPAASPVETREWMLPSMASRLVIS